jgi:RNA polymerase sigma-70 factor (ECF subfamily)
MLREPMLEYSVGTTDDETTAAGPFLRVAVVRSMTFSGATLHTEIASLLPRLRRSERTIAWQRDAADELLQLGIQRAQLRSNHCEAGTRLDCSRLTRALQGLLSDQARTVS